MKLELFPSTASHFRWPSHFLQSDGQLLNRPQPCIPELLLCHPSLYPSNLTSAQLMFQQLGLGESALGEKSKELAFIWQL